MLPIDDARNLVGFWTNEYIAGSKIYVNTVNCWFHWCGRVIYLDGAKWDGSDHCVHCRQANMVPRPCTGLGAGCGRSGTERLQS